MPIGTADLRRVSKITDPRRRTAACRDAMASLEAQLTGARRQRDAYVYAGTDRFDTLTQVSCRVMLDPARPSKPRVCVPPDFPGAVPCTRPHKGMGLCEVHYQAWREGKAWGGGGLELASEPVSRRGWRARALAISNIPNGNFARIERLRIYPTHEHILAPAAGGGWSQDPALWDRSLQGYWQKEPQNRRHPHLVVHELPPVPGDLDETTHWAQTGGYNTLVLDIKQLLHRFITEVRKPALAQIMADEPSNKALVELTGLDDQYLAQLRRELLRSNAA